MLMSMAAKRILAVGGMDDSFVLCILRDAEEMIKEVW